MQVIDKVKKELILKGNSQPVAPKPSLSTHIEALIKCTFGRYYLSVAHVFLLRAILRP